MNFLLKIVEGPNKGAEIALPDGVAVTLGKSDACDIVLADSSLPDEPLTLEASAGGVSAGGVSLEPLAVKTVGSTSFAVGPADAPWGSLKWPEEERGKREEGRGKREEGRVKREEEEGKREEEEGKREKRGGCCGCIVALLLLAAIAAVLGWVFRKQAKEYAEKAKPYAERAMSVFARSAGKEDRRGDAESPATAGAAACPLAEFAQSRGLVLTNRAGRAVLAGDFPTRAERLAAAAEAYAVSPGVELDFCDTESLKTAAEDVFALVGEKNLHIVAVTNRVLAVSGRSTDIKRVLEAMASDIPKLRNVDCSAVQIAAVPQPDGASRTGTASAPERIRARQPKPLERQPFRLPVCGILTTPYPCLVLRNGTRVLEGAPLGDSVVLKIEADSVTVTNSAGKFTWKP